MKVKWLVIALIVLFILMAPQDATNAVHSLVKFFQGVFSGMNLH